MLGHAVAMLLQPSICKITKKYSISQVFPQLFFAILAKNLHSPLILHHSPSPVFMRLAEEEWRILGYFSKFSRARAFKVNKKTITTAVGLACQELVTSNWHTPPLCVKECLFLQRKWWKTLIFFPFSLRMCRIMCNFAQYNRTKRRLLTSYDQAYE